MQFEKIIIPPGWQESFTKYPNGRTIFEALTSTITSVNEGIEEVNQKVNQGLLAIEQAENTIRQEITESFNTLKLQLEGEIDDLSSDLIADFALLQSDVLTLIAGKANAADVYTKQQVDAQLAEKVQNFKLKNDVVNGDFSQGATGWTSNPSINTISALNNTLIATITSVSGAAYIASLPPPPLDRESKIYISFKINPFRTHIPQVRIYDVPADLDKNAPSGVFTRVSNVIVRSIATVNPLFIYTNRFSTTDMVVGSQTQYKEVLVVNLTKIFGAGNEPTKLEMDELIKIIPNQWWDGELTLTQKQYITWQLNLIRKNTNAIIALGGTII